MPIDIYVFIIKINYTKGNQRALYSSSFKKTIFNFPNFLGHQFIMLWFPTPLSLLHFPCVVLRPYHSLSTIYGYFYVEPVVVLVNHHILPFLFLVPLENGHTPQDLITHLPTLQEWDFFCM